jgi:rod shape-determining protein MreD
VKSLLGAVIGIAAGMVLQIAASAWAPRFSDRIDLLLIVVVWLGVNGSQVLAMLSGAAAGLLQDVWFGGLLGRSGFRKIVVGYLVGAVGSRFELNTVWAWFAALFLSTIADHAVGVALGQVMAVPLADPFSMVLLERAFANGIVGTLLFALVERLLSFGRRRPGDRGAARRRASLARG